MGRSCHGIWIFKAYPRVILMQIKFWEPLLYRLGNQRSLRKILCLWHTEFLNVELRPGSTVTKDCLGCSSWGIWEGHEKDTTSARLISEKKSCKLVQNSLTSRFKLSLEGKAMAALGFCLCQRKRCVDGPKQILCLYLFYLIKDSAPSSCFAMVYPR